MLRRRCQVPQRLAWESLWDAKQEPLGRPLTSTRASGKWCEHTHRVSVPSSGCSPQTPRGFSGLKLPSQEGVWGRHSHVAPSIWAQSCDSLWSGASPEPTLPPVPEHQELPQQLHKVSFICDVQIQPMQNEIMFSL